jgi:hypothetical protein
MPYYISLGPPIEECRGFKASIRDITVVDGYPFYRSTGLNSSHEGCWLPFIMLRGTIPLDSLHLEQIPKIYSPDKLRTHIQEFDENFGENAQFNLIKPTVLSDNLPNSEKRIVPSDNFSEDFSQRLALKRFLIISARLNRKSYNAKQLKEADISSEEMTYIKSPIKLQSAGYFSDVDKVNEWLVKNGASYLNGVLHGASLSQSTILDSQGFFESKRKISTEKQSSDQITFKPGAESQNPPSSCCVIL